jgi:nucleoside-diphosphate-sugar epimerase
MGKTNNSGLRIVVTGSEGNIGSQLVPYLRECGHEVWGFDTVQAYKPFYIVGDVNAPAELAMLFSWVRPQVCFHMAAMVSRVTCEIAQARTVQTNLAGTQNVIELCKLYDTKMVYFSTSEVYGNIGGTLDEARQDLAPNNLYGMTKLLGERLVQYGVGCGLKAITLRPFMFYHEDETLGDHRSAMVRFVSDLLRNRPITVHQGSTRCWLHLYDGVRMLERLMYAPQWTTVNIGSREVTPTLNLAQYICSELDLDPAEYIRIVPLPQQMTLTKVPALDRLEALTGGYKPQISTLDGVHKVIKRLTTRLCSL